ncbi:MAG: choice-of-anchor tandem repeat GloVer-containing protein, partial [Candidatus Sulfotelmatobacter sp.]
TWTETVLHSFNGIDGSGPLAGVIVDAKGNLYGTTTSGGDYGGGTAFKLMPAEDGTWTETVLHSFNDNGTDGWEPLAGLTFDASGNLYGTTYQGGTGNCYEGCGTAFEITP